MDLETVLFNKDNFKFTRVNQNHYIIEFTIENNNIDLSKIIDFNLIKLIYDLNTDIYEMSLDDNSGVMALEENTWYSYLVNINQRQRTITQYVYKRDVDDEEDVKYLVSTKLRRLFSYQTTMVPVEILVEDNTAKLIGSDMKITNIRLFEDIVPEDQHNKILNQNVIRDDAKYLVFADNANTRLVLPSYPLGNMGRGEVS